MDKEGRRFARDYFWFALALIAILLGSTVRAAAAEESAPSAKKPTAEELERRIAILEKKLEAQQQEVSALLEAQRQALAQTPASPAVSPAAAPTATAGLVAQAASPPGTAPQTAPGS